MADSVQVIEGFEGGHWGKWDSAGVVSPLSKIVSAGPVEMTGDYAAYLDDGDYLRRAFATDADLDCMVALWYRPEQFVASQWVCAWYQGASLLAHLRVDPTTRRLKMYRGASTEFSGGTSRTYALTLGKRAKIYARVIFGASEFTATVYVDGIPVIGAQTATPGAATPADTFQLGGTKVKAVFDNILLGNKALDTRANYPIGRRLPDGAGSSASWTPSTAPNWHAVAKVPVDDSSYVKANAVDLRDLHSAENLSTDQVFSPGFLQVEAVVEKLGTPVPTKLNLSYRTGGTTYDGADQTPVSGKAIASIWEFTDPDLPHYDYLDDLEIGMRSRA